MTTQTDWNSYYENPSTGTTITRRITGKKLVQLMKKFMSNPTDETRICELGGANSCFFELIQKEIQPVHYTVLDNNELGLKKFTERTGTNPSVSSICLDLLTQSPPQSMSANVVFSVGLIEHFSVNDTARIIAAHFDYLEDNGLCIITFPTPTWLYKTSRKIAELLGKWIFWDERPLVFTEVEKEIEKYGVVVHKSITWSIIFTQGVIVARKRAKKIIHNSAKP